MSLIEKYKNVPLGVKASFWFLICGFFQKGIAVITTPIFTRLLNTSEYGEFSVFCSWQSIFICFITLNLGGSVYTRGLVKYKTTRYEFISTMQGLLFFLLAISLSIYIPFRGFINNYTGLSTIQFIEMCVLMILSTISVFWSTEQRIDNKYKALLIITVVVSVFRPLISIVFVYLAKDKVAARILGMLTVDLIAYGWIIINYLVKGKKVYDKEIWKETILFTVPLIPHYLSMNVLSGADRIMIGSMVGNSAAGVYNLAYSLSQIMTIFNAALLQTIDPWLYKTIDARETKKIAPVAYISFMVIGSVNIALIAFAPEAVKLFAPRDYYEAINLIPPIAMSVPFMFAYSFFAVFEFSYGKTYYVTFATIIASITNIGLNFLLIRIFGYIAAGYTTLLCYIILAFMHFYFMKKSCKMKEVDEIYNSKYLLVLMLFFLSLGFVFLFSYKYIFVRYGLIVVFIGIVIIKRRIIVEKILMLNNMRKQH